MRIKFIAAAAIALSALLGTTAFAADNAGPFKDVSLSTEEGQAIEKMYNAGYLKGYEDGTFKPEATITRAELTRVFNQVFGYELDEEKAETTPDFADIDKKAWYYNDVRIAQTNGYINGFNDNTFRPQDNFTREQTCVVIALAGKLENKEIKPEILDAVSPWALEYVDTVINNGIIPLENGSFRAKENITRGEVCRALVKFVNTENAGEDTSKSSSTADKSSESTTNDNPGGSSSSGGSSSGGSGSSGGSSSSGNGSSGGTSSSGNGSSGSTSSSGNGSSSTTQSTTSSSTTTTTTTTTTTEEQTEATTQEPSGGGIELSPSQKSALSRIISGTRNSLRYAVKTDAEVDLVKNILAAMSSYEADNSFDITSAVYDAKALYDALTPEEKDDFKQCAMSIYDPTDIMELRNVFGPLIGM